MADPRILWGLKIGNQELRNSFTTTYGTVSQSVASQTATDIPVDVSRSDGNAFSIAGNYLIEAIVKFPANATGFRLARFKSVGSSTTKYYATIRTNACSNGQTAMTLFSCVYGNVGDTLYVEIIQNSGSAQNVSVQYIVSVIGG